MLLLAEFIVWVVGVAALVYYFLSINAPVRRKRAQTLALSTQDAPTALIKPKKSAWRAYRLTTTTFLIIEVNDAFGEHPYMYAKIVPAADTILLLDTGCGGATFDRDVDITNLREFVETVGVEDNGGRPLNEGGRMRYIVVLSHCHYDHILGVELFAHDSPILESMHSPSFVSEKNLPAHSLCKSLGLRTPSFTPTLVPHNHPILSASDMPLSVRVLHTPGHTPDELALWDAGEQMLYVGDTLYEFEPIMFPNEGDIRSWLSSVDELIAVVMASCTPAEVLINCGHRTAMRPALDILHSAKQFMMDVLLGKEKARRRTVKRGVEFVEYMQAGGRYRMQCPERLVEEARSVVRMD